MHIRILAGVAVLALTACATPQQIATQSDVQMDSSEGADSQLVTFRDDQKSGNAGRGFTYSWPQEVSALPRLAAHMTALRDKALKDQKTEWKQQVAEYGSDDCVTCVSRDFDATWSLVADTGRFLSLEGGVYTYTGGAHGGSYFDSLVWDREAGTAMKPIEMFTSAPLLWSAIRDDYCAGLNRVRAERRGMAAAGTGYDWECPKFDQLVVVPNSSDGTTFDRLELLAAPYVAGPYVEGSFEVNIAITQAALAAVKPDYRSHFSVGD